MMDRIIRALMFKKGVFADAKKHAGFTRAAWLMVFISAFLGGIGSAAGPIGDNTFGWLFGSLFWAGFAVLGFFAACLAIMMMTAWLSAKPLSFSFRELVRALGLASIWQAFGVLEALVMIFPGLGAISGFFMLTATMLGIAAWVVALREAFAMSWWLAILMAVISKVIILLITIAGMVALGAVPFLNFIK